MVESRDKGITKNIRDKAYEFIQNSPDGIRYSELVAKIRNEFPKYKEGTIAVQVTDLPSSTDYGRSIERVDRGIYKPKSAGSSGKVISASGTTRTAVRNEEKFYAEFARFVRDDLVECTHAVKYGNNRLQNDKKWFNPDIVGFYHAGLAGTYQRAPDIVTGELKTSTAYKDAIEGFAQAAAYRLFSHKSYLALPKEMSSDDIDVVESLCIQFGLGFVLFNRRDPQNAQFTLRNRALWHEPNIAYLNKYGQKIIEYLQSEKSTGKL